jgi:hypothetical protein
MYAEMAVAAASIKTFRELTALILKAKVDSAVTQKAIESEAAIIDLQTAIINLQSQHQTLLRYLYTSKNRDRRQGDLCLPEMPGTS